jgi:hypothetical protein
MLKNERRGRIEPVEQGLQHGSALFGYRASMQMVIWDCQRGIEAASKARHLCICTNNAGSRTVSFVDSIQSWTDNERRFDRS